MRISVEVTLPCSAARAFSELDDLEDYPRWTGLVHAATRDSGVDSDSSQPVASWTVELRGRIGPFARSKKLRMERVFVDEPSRVRFERRETDGRDHGSWILEAVVIEGATDDRASCDVRVTLEYGGRLWSGAIEKLLADEIERSKHRLRDLVSA